MADQPHQPTFSQGNFDIQLPKWPLEDQLLPLGDGVNGEVFKCKITDADWKALAVEAPRHTTAEYFAVKRNLAKRKKQGELERDFLLALKKYGVDHKHLVMCYACIEAGGRFYIVMDLAEGHLDSFMARYSDGREKYLWDEEVWLLLDGMWLLTQMHGLAGALAAIHTAGGTPGMMGFHHDIKPENILYFKTNGRVEFRITDWTTAKMMSTDSLGHEDTGWPAYLPPETLGNKTACEPDVWSLGCVFLELLIWFDEGYHALDSVLPSQLGFRQRRCAENGEYSAEVAEKLENSYRAKNDDLNIFYGPGNFLLDVVSSQIESLKSQHGAGTNWIQIMKIVEEMLCIEANQRLSAPGVRDRLGEILEKRKENGYDGRNQHQDGEDVSK